LVGSQYSPTLSKMSSHTFNREYLLNLPTDMRKQHMKQYVEQYVHQILGAARLGNTSYMISENSNQGKPIIAHYQIQPWRAPPTQEEICEALLEKFPDCKITYVEKWVSTGPTQQELKKGLVVDWS
jgi:hypothetical protein